MVYLIVAVVMGFFVGNNHRVQSQVRGSIGAAYANPTLGLMSSLGSFAGWFTIIPAAVIVATARHYGFWDGIFFVAAAFAGAFLAGFPFVGIGGRYILSVATLSVHIALVVFTYFYFH